MKQKINVGKAKKKRRLCMIHYISVPNILGQQNHAAKQAFSTLTLNSTRTPSFFFSFFFFSLALAPPPQHSPHVTFQPPHTDLWAPTAPKVKSIPHAPLFNTKASHSSDVGGRWGLMMDRDPEGERAARVAALTPDQAERITALTAELQRVAQSKTSSHGAHAARRLGTLGIRSPAVVEALHAGKASPLNSLQVESARALLELGVRDQMETTEALLFGWLVSSSKTALLRSILGTLRKMKEDDTADHATAVRRQVAMDKRYMARREQEQMLRMAPSSQRQKHIRKIAKLTAEIDCNAAPLQASLQRAKALPPQTPVLCAGVKHVVRCARGPVTTLTAPASCVYSQLEETHGWWYPAPTRYSGRRTPSVYSRVR